jgi:hypothetical protein
MRGFVAPLVIVGVCAAFVAGCSSQSPVRPTPASDQAIAHGLGFGALTSGAPTAGPVVDLAGCLRPVPASNCISAAHANAPGTVAGLLAPTAPGNLVASAVGSSVTLRWVAPSGGDLPTGYIIEAGSLPGAANLANFATGNTSTSFFASGIGNGTYYVRVRALNSAGPSAPSNEATLIVASGPCVAPAPPSALTIVSNSGGTVVLSWASASGSPSSYSVEAGSSPGLANLANSDVGLTTTLTATGVGAGTYYVRVRARNACGTSGPSNEIVVTVAAVGTPGVITIAAETIAAGASDASSHGVTLTLDGRLVTTTFVNPPVPALYPRFQGTLAPGTHEVVATMTSWDSLLFFVGSNPAGTIDAASFVVVSSNWSITPFSTRAACSGRVLFSGRATGSIRFRFNVVAGIAAASCPALSPNIG